MKSNRAKKIVNDNNLGVEAWEEISSRKELVKY
jgi:hypothetical protein